MINDYYKIILHGYLIECIFNIFTLEKVLIRDKWNNVGLIGNLVRKAFSEIHY